METATITLIIASLTLVTAGTFFYFYLKTVKEQRQTSQQQVDQTVTKLEDIKNLIENIVKKESVELKEKYDTSTKLLRTGISELANLTEQLIKESSELKKSINTDTKELVENNEEFKKQLMSAHKQALEDIRTELNNILTAIKAPLDLD
jgi:predicted  nucleic acid-binding Zn-ribbon protein